MRPTPDYSLYLVTDRPLCHGRQLLEVVLAAVAGGVGVVQLREKTAPTREFVALARALKTHLTPRGVLLFINDRLDVALAAGADGIHVGQSDMAVEDVRRLTPPQLLLGLSVETPEQLRAAEKQDIDYYGLGPILATATKPDHAPPWGVEGLRRARELTRRPLVAIGGIGQENAADIVAAGADGVAVVSALCSAPDVETAARHLLDAVTHGRARG